MKDRLNSSFFRGWQRVPVAGSKRFRMEYTGELYGFRLEPARLRALKWTRALVFAAYLAVYLLGALLVSDGAMWRIVALPQLLTLVAVLWLAIGVGCTVLAPERCPYRDYRGGPVRTLRSAWAGAVLTALTLLAELAYLILFAGQYAFGREVLFLLEIAFCIAANVWFILDCKKHPCVIVEGPKEK